MSPSRGTNTSYLCDSFCIIRSARPEVEICRSFGLSNASFSRNRHQIAAEVSFSVRKSGLGIEAAVDFSPGAQK